MRADLFAAVHSAVASGEGDLEHDRFRESWRASSNSHTVAAMVDEAFASHDRADQEARISFDEFLVWAGKHPCIANSVW